MALDFLVAFAFILVNASTVLTERVEMPISFVNRDFVLIMFILDFTKIFFGMIRTFLNFKWDGMPLEAEGEFNFAILLRTKFFFAFKSKIGLDELPPDISVVS